MTTVEDVLAGRAKWCVIEGDSRVVVPTLPAACVNAVVTDPPSGISFMGAAWDHHKGGRAQWVAWLAAILAASRVACVDGARLVSWAMPRTSHWTGCAIEDAGWIIETKGVHLFGTGWPKGKSQLKPAAEDWWFARTGSSQPLNVDACRVACSGGSPSIARRETSARTGAKTRGVRPGGIDDRTSHERYIEAREGEAAGRYPPNTLLTHAMECERVGVRRVENRSSGYCGAKGVSGGLQSPGSGWGTKNTGEAVGYADPDGTETVDDWRCVEGCPVRALGEQSGVLTSGAWDGRRSTNKGNGVTLNPFGAVRDESPKDGDTGTAARFFPQFQHAPEEVPFLYCAKPSSAEKRAGLSDDDPRHPTVKPVDLMRWLIRLVTKPGDVVLDTFCGSATTGVAAIIEGRRFIGIERAPDDGEQAFAPIARARLEHAAPSRERLATMTSTPVRVEAADFGPLFNR